MMRFGVAQSRCFGSSVKANLHYQKLIPGKTIGRYINTTDKGDIADEHVVS